MNHSTWQGQMRAARTLALVEALRMAHDDARDTISWPTLKEEQQEHCRGKKHGDSRDREQDRRMGGGVLLAAANAAVSAATVGVAAPITAVEEAAVAEAAATRLRLGVAEDPGTVRVVVLGDTTGEVVAAGLGAVKVDAGMAREAVPMETARKSLTALLLVFEGDLRDSPKG